MVRQEVIIEMDHVLDYRVCHTIDKYTVWSIVVTYNDNVERGWLFYVHISYNII